MTTLLRRGIHVFPLSLTILLAASFVSSASPFLLCLFIQCNLIFHSLYFFLSTRSTSRTRMKKKRKIEHASRSGNSIWRYFKARDLTCSTRIATESRAHASRRFSANSIAAPLFFFVFTVFSTEQFCSFLFSNASWFELSR